MDSFEQCVKYLDNSRNKKRNIHLLMGNGFSMAYDYNIFSYNALSKFIMSLKNEELKKLFQTINTYNFEEIMTYLDVFRNLIKEFDPNSSLYEKLKILKNDLRISLIQAVENNHPECVFSLTRKQIKSCLTFFDYFLNRNGYIFSTNYDLLLYWVLMAGENKQCKDGFGRDLEKEEDNYVEPNFSELRWGRNSNGQNIFFLHGALHLFNIDNEVIKIEYDGTHILQKIKEKISNNIYPIFVTAGDGEQKLKHIKSNFYLADCYDKLCKITGSLIVYGFNFGKYDEHIIKAINKAANQPKGHNLLSIYIGVYSEDDKKHIESIKDKFDCKVNIFDSKTINPWKITENIFESN